MTIYEQPDVTEFIAKHGRSYDDRTDDYRRPPFAQLVKAKRSGAIYNAHTYHTKVPAEGIVPYIEHYTEQGDLVLDPFCGSGMTGVAALMSGRRAVLNDLSPAAVHIAYNYCTPVDVKSLNREFVHIQKEVEKDFDWLYGTVCDRCGGRATIQYTIWSDTFECARCSTEIVLWKASTELDEGRMADEFACPVCQAKWTKKDLQWLRSVPVVTNYQCHSCRPGRGEHPACEEEKRLVAEIEASEIPYWYPRTPFDASWEMWRGAHGEQQITDISRLYTRRNLWALARLWHEAGKIQSAVLRKKVQFAITAISLAHASRMTRIIFKAGKKPILTSNQTGTLYLPSFSAEKNLLEVLNRKFNDIQKAMTVLRDVDPDGVRVLTGSASKLSEVPDQSIDYVFTDPPFGSNIFYADCNLVWEAWLDQGFTDQTNEAVVHVKQKDKNTLPAYAELMEESFREMYRVLKPGRWASVVFHNSDDRIWQVILDAAETAKFELAEINSFDKEQLSFKGVRGEKGLERVTNQDIVLNLLKPRPGRAPATNGGTHLVESEQRVVETVADFLQTNPAPAQRTLQHIWNHVLYDMLREGSVQVSMADVEAMLAYHSQTFKLVDGRYYLRGEAVIGGNVFDLSSDAGAIAWLTAVLSNEPQTIGELIPKWQQETARLGGVDPGRLDRLLAQNFWQDERSGRWQVPTTAQRERMSARADLSAQAHLRVVQRFLDGDLDRQPNDWELCSWIRFCYNREFFAESMTLFAHVDEARVNPDEYREIKRIVAVCRMRAGQKKE